jgi:hypothetical protein
MKRKNFDSLKELIDRVDSRIKTQQLVSSLYSMKYNFIDAKILKNGLISVKYTHNNEVLEELAPNPCFFFKNCLGKIICIQEIYYRVGILNVYDPKAYVKFESKNGTSCSKGTAGRICLIPV